MKENRIDELFRKRLEGYSPEPSQQAVESLRAKLKNRRKAFVMRRWAIAATVTLFGTAAIWSGIALFRGGSMTDAEQNMAVIMPDDPKTGPGGQARFEEERTSLRQAKVTESSTSQKEEGETRKTIKIQEEAAIDMAENKEDASSKRTASPAVAVGPVPESTGIAVQEEVKVVSADDNDGFNGAERENDVTMANPDDNMEQVEEVPKVPVRIVYKKTGSVEPGKAKKKRILKNGFRKITATLDKLNLRNGAKNKLKKTREDLVAMNPVKIFTKDRSN